MANTEKPNKRHRRIERLRKLDSREDLATLNPGDLVRFKNIGYFVYDSKRDDRMVFYQKGILGDGIDIWEINERRISLLVSGVLAHHLSQIQGDKSYSIREDDKRYNEMMGELKNSGII